jgi:hypothetical protein
MKKQGSAGGQRGTTDQAKGHTGGAGEQAMDAAASAASEVRAKGGELLDEGREKVQELGAAAGEMARSKADQQMERVVEGIRIFADVLRQGTGDLSGERTQYRGMLNSVADRAEDVSRYLEDRDVRSVSREVQRFASENTPLFLGGAFALGLLGARFLKSSSDRQQGYDWDYGPQQRHDRMLPPQVQGRPGYGGYGAGYGPAGGYAGAGSYGGPGSYPGAAGGSYGGTGTGASQGTGTRPAAPREGSSGVGGGAGASSSGSLGGSAAPGGSGSTGAGDRGLSGGTGGGRNA